MQPAPTTEPTAPETSNQTASNEQPASARPATTMVETIGNKNHAEQWFLRHSNGTCSVRGSNGETRDVSSYPEACVFFDKNGEN